MKLYQWGDDLLYTRSVDVPNDSEDLPPRSTTTPPPALTGTQVAAWGNAGWKVLPKAPDTAPPLADRQAAALALLNADFTRAMASLQSGWPDYEVKTWDIQAEEAKQWTAASDQDKPMTPFLTQLYTQRAVLGWTEPFGDLVARIVANTQAYTLATANYIAIRHVAERNINAATDPSTVKWSFWYGNEELL